MRERSVLGVDIYIALASVALVAIGVLFIYSSGVTSGGDSFSNEWIRQIIWASIGIVMMIGVSLIDYSRVRDWTPYLYGAAIAILVGTLLFGRIVNGAKSWIGIGNLGVQPSEFAKIATILLLANVLSRRQNTVGNFGTFALTIGITAIPVVLILAQGDLGTALVYIPIFLVVAFVAGVKRSYLIFLVGTAGLLVVLTVIPAWQQFTGREQSVLVRMVYERRLFALVAGSVTLVGVIGLLGAFILKQRTFVWVTYVSAMLVTALAGAAVALQYVLEDYQLMRLVVFLDPTIDPQGAGWNVIQSVTAVGSGGIAGKGWLGGTQSHLQYLPQQSTDFIFSILAEEWGFAGALGVFVAYGVVLTRGLIVCAKAKDNFAVYAGVGIVTMIFFHVAVNVGMAMGIMPITGIPLLFVSYGGSALWTALISVGILMSIYQHRYRY